MTNEYPTLVLKWAKYTNLKPFTLSTLSVMRVQNNVNKPMFHRSQWPRGLRPPHTRTVLPSVLTAQAKLCQVCTVWPARGFTTHAQLKLKEIDQFNL